MKKSYFSFLAIFTVFAVLQAQDTYVTGAKKVKVESGTLFYHGGNFNIINAAAGAANTVINEGKIKIQEGYANQASLDAGNSNNYLTGNNFVNVWNGIDDYGQVIIAQSGTATGYLNMQKNPISTDDFDFGQFSIPFKYDSSHNTNSDAFKYLFGASMGYQGDCPVNANCGGRYRQSLFSWDNTNYESDSEQTAGAVNPTKYYMLNFTNSLTGLAQVMNASSNTNPLNYKGIPTPQGFFLSLTNAGHPYGVNSEWLSPPCGTVAGENCWSQKKNHYNEKFSTFVDDSYIDLVDLNTGSNQKIYGKYSYQFGNPYTSNVDLSNLGAALSNLKGVSKYSVVNSTEQNGGQNTTNIGNSFELATYNAGSWVGSPEALLVKPFEPFIITLKDEVAQTFTLDDSYKTFKMQPTGPITNRPESSTAFYQIKLYLVNDDSEETLTDNKLFIVASEDAISAKKLPYEADYSNFTDVTTGFYGLQEKYSISPLTTYTPLFINAINVYDYIAKPINLVFNRAGEGSFKLKAKLFQGSIFNQIQSGNFTDGNSYYFYDKELDVIKPIDNEFEYEISNDIESSDDRFIVYWNGYPNLDDTPSMSTNDLDASRTIVYKDGSQYKVRFNKNWNSANVEAYDVIGRKVYTATNLKTTSDHILNLSQQGVYIIKSQNEKGETEIQKIIIKR